jgi:hypothetical protein
MSGHHKWREKMLKRDRDKRAANFFYWWIMRKGVG